MNIDRLLKIPSDTTGTQLFIDPNNKDLYFADQNSETATAIIKDGVNLKQTTEIDEYDIFIDTKGIAIEKQQDGNYLLSIKMTAQPLDPSLVNLINGRQWILYTIGKNGIIISETILSSIKSEESKFNQDVDGDKGIGLSIDILTKKESDTVGTQLFIDSDKFLYFADENSNKPIPIIDKDGDQLKDIYFSYEGNFDNKIAIVIEKQSDDNYLLAVRNKLKIKTDQQDIDKTEWILYTIDQDGKIKDEKKLSSTIEFKSEESKFNQDVDDDKGIGLSIDILTKKESDTVGTQLFVNSTTNINQDGITIKASALYFVDENDTIPKPIIDKDGEQLKETYFSRSDSTEHLKAIAIEKQPDGNYLLAMINKVESIYGNVTEYILYTIGKDGQAIDKKKLSSKEFKSEESKFKQNIYDDNMTDETKESDTVRIKLFVNFTNKISEGANIREGALNFVDYENGNTPIPIIDKNGEILKEKYSSHMGTNTELKVIAIEKQSDGNYLLLMINIILGGLSFIEYILYTIGQDGKVIDKKKLSSNTSEAPSRFPNLTKKKSDTTGTKLFVDSTTSVSRAGATLREADLYFLDDENDENDTIPKPILDKDGDKLKEEYVSYNGFVSDLKAIAIEKQPDDNYLLAMIDNIQSMYGNFTEYILYTIGKDGQAIDKKKIRDLKLNEYNFKQDLNNDGKIGPDLENIDNKKTKLLVDVQKRNGDTNIFHLYFQPEDSKIPKPIIERFSDDIFKLNTWVDFVAWVDMDPGITSTIIPTFPIAIEKLTEDAQYKGNVIAKKGEYLLLIKEKGQKGIAGPFDRSTEEDRKNEQESVKRTRKKEEWGYYELYTVSSNGKIKSSPILGISYYDINELEKYFGTDINNDFQNNDIDSPEDPKNKGFKLINVNTDTNGVKLWVNKDNFLFIEDEDNFFRITPVKKKMIIKLPTIVFDYLDNFKVPPGNEVNKNDAYAVEKIQRDNITYRNQVIALKGDYLLAVKKETKALFNVGTNVNWDLYVLENTGFDAILKKTLINVPVKDFEQYFNQDLNEDGNIGKVTSKQTTRNQVKNKTSLKVHEVFTLHNKKTINMKVNH